MAYASKGDYEKSLEYNNNALAARIKTFGEQHPDVALSYNNMAFTFEKAGMVDKALEYYDKALRVFEATLGKDHPYYTITKENADDLKSKL